MEEEIIPNPADLYRFHRDHVIMQLVPDSGHVDSVEIYMTYLIQPSARQIWGNVYALAIARMKNTNLMQFPAANFDLILGNMCIFERCW